jgi:hypothetical protein
MSNNICHLEEKYDEIMKLYDLADELAATVDSNVVENPEAQLKLVEPIIEQLGGSADELTEEFINAAEGKIKRTTRNRVEASLRKIYNALDEYTMKAHGNAKLASARINNIADSIITKIKEELEKIVIIFLDFMQLSLDRVMHKNEYEELKRRHTEIAFQLHHMSQQP